MFCMTRNRATLTAQMSSNFQMFEQTMDLLFVTMSLILYGQNNILIEYVYVYNKLDNSRMHIAIQHSLTHAIQYN